MLEVWEGIELKALWSARGEWCEPLTRLPYISYIFRYIRPHYPPLFPLLARSCDKPRLSTDSAATGCFSPRRTSERLKNSHDANFRRTEALLALQHFSLQPKLGGLPLTKGARSP